ncbi:IS66 family insertion sequence element accessory protein TnpB [Ectopseudomonas oleovorans]|uniref:IS66 family insertion sequence element accessory protein TnpB n=1 Tax=Ectopseudomonas oleovorans TaxID=301 RepID=UPI003F1D7961
MMRPDAKVQKVYLYPKPVDFRKSINGLAALVELDIKVEVFNPVLFVFLNRTRSAGQDSLLGAQWLLPVAQATGSRAFQDQTRCR